MRKVCEIQKKIFEKKKRVKLWLLMEKIIVQFREIIDGFCVWIKYFQTLILLNKKKKWVNIKSEKIRHNRENNSNPTSDVTRHAVDSDNFWFLLDVDSTSFLYMMNRFHSEWVHELWAKKTSLLTRMNWLVSSSLDEFLRWALLWDVLWSSQHVHLFVPVSV